MKITHNNIEYEIELDNVVFDHDYWMDAYICAAYDVTNKRELSDEQVQELQDSVDMCELIMRWLY